jgi:hypothetical protein
MTTRGRRRCPRRLPCSQARHCRGRRVSPPGPARHPGPPRPHPRAIRSTASRSSACWRREAHRQAVGLVRERDRRPRRAPRGLRRVVVRPTAPIGLPPPRPGRRQEDRREGPRELLNLPDPRDRETRPHPEALAGRVPGLLRHRQIEQRRHRSRQRPHRAPPPRRPRVQQLRELRPTHAPHRRRPHQPHLKQEEPY